MAEERAAEEQLAKAQSREERIRKKKELVRARLARIEEAMFKKRQEKEAKKRAKYKADAIKKAARTKKEMDSYSLRSDIDQRRFDKAKRLEARGDMYFEKEMYKEAGKLYDRASLTIRGKYY